MLAKLGRRLLFRFCKVPQWGTGHQGNNFQLRQKGQTISISQGSLTQKILQTISGGTINFNLQQGAALEKSQTMSLALSLINGKRGLYQILPISKTLNKSILSMAYTPGVGRVCKQIQKYPQLVDQLTMRTRSVAIITQGNCFEGQKIQPGKMTPILDWCIAQIKYYSDVDSYPFIIRQGANMTNVIKDLSNTYGAILILDPQISFNQEQIPADVAIVKQKDICKLNGNSSVIDCQNTSKILGYVLSNKKRGIIGQDILKEGLKYNPNILSRQTIYESLYRDSRNIGQKSYDFHRKLQGKIHLELNFKNINTLKSWFTQQNLIHIAKNKLQTNGYQNLSTIVTDGTAILGFGDIGPKAGLPVMQGKSMLFKVLGGVNVVPVCINKRKTTSQAIQAILDIASYFKAINLEDIKAPQCFYIERGIKSKNLLPVFHDDQHGTAVVTLAALINALKLAEKKPEDVKVVITGVGAAGISTCKLLIEYGIRNIIMFDTKGAIYEGRKQGMNPEKQQIAKITNPNRLKGSLGQVINGADVFIGVSGPGTFKKQMVKSMKAKPIVFALANPDPQITITQAMQGGAFVYGSGRSDIINQINNSLVFPGIFRGIHDHHLPEITEQMKVFVAKLIAQNIDRTPTQSYVIIDSLDTDIPILIADGLKNFRTAKPARK